MLRMFVRPQFVSLAFLQIRVSRAISMAPRARISSILIELELISWYGSGTLCAVILSCWEHVVLAVYSTSKARICIAPYSYFLLFG